MTDLLDLSRPLPHRRNPAGQRLCSCPSGPCLNVARADGRCIGCRRFCAAREPRED